jgi:hypothetical protein
MCASACVRSYTNISARTCNTHTHSKTSGECTRLSTCRQSDRHTWTCIPSTRSACVLYVCMYVCMHLCACPPLCGCAWIFFRTHDKCVCVHPHIQAHRLYGTCNLLANSILTKTKSAMSVARVVRYMFHRLCHESYAYRASHMCCTSNVSSLAPCAEQDD